MTNESPQAMLFRDKHHGVSVGHFSWGMIYWWFRKGGGGWKHHRWEMLDIIYVLSKNKDKTLVY